MYTLQREMRFYIYNFLRERKISHGFTIFHIKCGLLHLTVGETNI